MPENPVSAQTFISAPVELIWLHHFKLMSNEGAKNS
jgi:hypothetical protein